MSDLIVLATGGTGGHVFPAQALAEELGTRGYRLALVTDRRGDAYSGPLGSLDTYMISAAGVSGRGKLGVVSAMAKLALGYFQARKVLGKLRPAAVVGFGGYPSLPTMMAASHLGLKTVVHEQNAVLGRANRLMAPRVNRIAASFEYTAELRARDQKKAVWTGNPVRPEIAALTGRPYPMIEADGRFNILITGGSQGAAVFGDTVPAALGKLSPDMRKRLHVTQQVRAEQITAVEERYAEMDIAADLRTFLNDIPEQLALSHLVICRAGASTMAELTTAGRPAILVPYPYAVDDHQTANAARLCDAAGAWMTPQSDLTADSLASRLTDLLNNPKTLANAAQAAARIGMPEATRNLADVVEGLVNGNCKDGCKPAKRALEAAA